MEDGDEPEVVSLDGASYKAPDTTHTADAQHHQDAPPAEVDSTDGVVPRDFVWQQYVRMYPDLHNSIGTVD